MEKKNLIPGIIASVVVPYTSGGEVDADLLCAEVKLLDQSAIDGLCVGGLLSGMAGATPKELYAISASVRRNSVKPLFAMVFPDVTVEALEMSRAVFDGGAEAILVAQPHYLCQPNESGLLEMFAELRKSVSCPLLLADCFPDAKVNIKVIHSLMSKRLVDGVLEAADVHSLVDLLCLHPDTPIYSGVEDLHYVAFMLGAHGAISDLAAIFPRDLSDLYRFFQNGRHEDARSRHERLVRLWRVLDATTEREGRVRSALMAQGRDVGTAPSPYSGLSVEAACQIETALHSEGFTLASSG